MGGRDVGGGCGGEGHGDGSAAGVSVGGAVTVDGFLLGACFIAVHLVVFSQIVFVLHKSVT